MAGFIEKNHLADYRTGNSGGEGGLREACELLMGLGGDYDELVRLRMKYHGRYSEYFKLRQKVTPSYFDFRDDEIKPLES